MLPLKQTRTEKAQASASDERDFSVVRESLRWEAILLSIKARTALLSSET